MKQRPPHLLPGQTAARRTQLLRETPLESWQDEIARGGVFSAEKLAALALVLGIIFSQIGFIAVPAEAASPSFRAASSGSNGGGSTVTATLPVGVAENDVMLAVLGQKDNVAVTPPVGWTHIRQDASGGAVSQDLYFRVATASEPGSYQWTLGGSTSMAWAVLAYSGVDTAAPINAHGGQGNGESSSYAAPSITTTEAETTLVAFFASVEGGPTSPPAGMSELVDQAAGGAATEAADEQLAVAGPTGIRTASGANGLSVGQAVALAAAQPASGVVTVNSTGDGADDNAGDDVCDTGGTVGSDPECTLRAAIQEANASATIDAIEFDIPQTDGNYSASPERFTIQPGSLLPEITAAMTIDGSTQPEYTTHNRPVIEVDGNNVSAGEENGFWITGGGTTIRSLAINRFGDDAIDIEFLGGNTIVGNYVGTDVTGTVAQANEWGINIKTTGNTVGGADPADRNVVSGNNEDGIYVKYAAATDNVFVGNYVGTNAAGTAGIGNGNAGFIVFDSASDNQIGGVNPGEGNLISGNGGSGVLITGASSTGNTIEGNVIGLNADGDTAIGNTLYGVHIASSSNNTIGGSQTAARNVIAGNDGDGVVIAGAANTIAGNYIGTNAVGSSAIGNDDGVYVSGSNNTVGGPTAAERNVISGNDAQNLRIDGDDNTVIGNYIGTDASGTAALGGGLGGGRGVWINGGANNTVGGDTVAARNVISGNSYRGVVLGNAATGNVVIGNYVGADVNGSALPNIGAGIEVQWDTDANQIGGDGSGEGNVIAHNSGPGVVVADVPSTDNTILGNSIHSNAGIGIDLGDNGVTANDAGDADPGPNGLLNFPVITSATDSGGTVTVDFDLDVPDGSYRVEFFDNTAADPSGNGEGETWVGSVDATVTSGVLTPSTTTFSGSAGNIITATATAGTSAPFGATSEFAAARAVVGAPNTSPSASIVGGPFTIAEGEPLDLDGSGSSDPDTDPLTYAWDLDNDGAYDNATGETPSVSWATLMGLGLDDDGGPYPIGLEVDDGMTTATDSTTLTITNTGPDVVVAGTGTATAGLAYAATVSVVEPGDDTVTWWNISWGDGTSTTTTGPLATVSHTYAAAGHYNITAAVIDEDGYWTDADLFVPSWEATRHLGRYKGATGAFEAELAGGTTTQQLGEAVVGPDGYLYVSSYLTGQIARFDPATNAFHDYFATTGIVGPLGLTFGPGGDLYVSDRDNNLVRRYNGSTGADMGTFASGGGLVSPAGLTFGPDGNLWVVSNGGANTVIRYDGSSGTPIAVFTSVGGTEEPEDIEFGPDGNVYVAYTLTDRVGRFDVSDGTLLNYFIQSGDAGLDEASGIEWGPDGDLYVSSRKTNEIKRYLRDTGVTVGNFVAAGAGGLTGPMYGSFLPDHQLVVAAFVPVDSDGDGLWDHHEDANTDADNDPSTNPGPNTDGDANPNYLDADDDGDGTGTASENADPNSDGDPRDARDADRDRQPDYLDAPTSASNGLVADEQLISDSAGGLTTSLGVSDHFGRAVAPIGDIDGDGVNDIAVGVPNDDDGSSDRGAVFILFMNGDGTVKGEQKISDTVGGFAAVLDNADEFGIGVAGLGDLDGDGINDIAVGAHQDDDGLNGNGGAVYVLFLNSSGTVKSYQKISEIDGGLGVLFNANDRFGGSVANVGDLDGDGLNDIVVGAKDDDDGFANAGAVYVLFLNGDGTVKSHQKISQTTGGLSGTPLGGSDGFGIGVAGLGDVDGDGTNDIAVGSYWDDDGGTNHGAAYVLFLNTDGTVKGQQKISDTEGSFTGTLESNDEFGTAVGALGDVDADGVPDLIVGAPKDDDGRSLSGAVYLILLNSNGTVKAEQKISNDAGNLASPIMTSDQFGFAVAGIGDLDGDGTIGLAVGTFGDDDGLVDSGSVYIIDLAEPGLVVNSTDDDVDSNVGDGVCDTGQLNSGAATECTLRAAIEEANADSDAGLIEFDLPVGETGHSGGVWTISPGSAFDPLTETVIVDGRTQPGWTTTPVVEINGAGAGATTDGFRIAADKVAIRGLAINRFFADGLEVANGAADAVIAQNHVGLDASGLVDRGNAGRGIDLGSGSGPTSVGGLEVTDRNVISGNGGDGIIIFSSNGNTVLNNFVGTDVTGNAGIANGTDGIALGGTSASNLIGQVGDINVISGNANDGIVNDATGATNAIYYNIIGLGIDADTLVPNGRHGVVLHDGANNTFVYQNVISGNTESGVVIDGNGNASTSANNIIGNWIGIGLSSVPRPNGSHGVHISRGATLNVIGGTPAAYHNVISGNGIDGIRIEGSATSGNRVENNYIGTNIAGDTGVGNGNNGVFIVGAPSNTVGGPGATYRNVISGNGNNGILIDAVTATWNTIQGNYIGLNAAGDAAIPNVDEGVDLSDASGTQVGGPTTDVRNVISGNGDSGVLLIGAGTTGNVVSGNYIGTNAAGDAAVPNGRAGVYVENDASANDIGGLTADEGNVISGNTEDGIFITGAGTRTNRATFNYIGTNAAGDAAIPNGDRGVQVESGASSNWIGDIGSGNVISGNTGDGVIIADWLALGTTDNKVIDNLIGVAADGTTPLGNGSNGIHLDPVATTMITGNTIAHNGADGVTLEPGALSGNTILGNSIHSNSQLGIDLENDGVSGNDGGDGDAGPNDMLNYPVITSATAAGGTVSVDFTLDVPAGDYTIEFFDNGVADPSGSGEGETGVHLYDVVGHPGGSASYSTSFAGALGDIITATTTEEAGFPYGSTSEFSVAVSTIAAGLTVNSTGDGGDNNLGDGICYTGGVNSDTDPECTLRAAIEEANAQPGVDTILFAIPIGDTNHSAGVWTIAPGSQYDDIDTTMSINGATQPGWVLDPVIEIDGSSVSTGSAGLYVLSSNSEVRSLILHSFPDEGLEADGSTGGGDGNTFAGNWVGIDENGAPAPNAGFGILLTDGASTNTVGGPNPADANVIGSNVAGGLGVWKLGADNNRIHGNYIGVLHDGVTPVPNAGNGVDIDDQAFGNEVGGTNAEANTIRSNSGDGVYVSASAGINNSVLRNVISGNAGLGINLYDPTDPANGVTLNDLGDGDGGPNDLLNYPVIDSAVIAPPWITVNYTIDAPAGDYAVEFFSNPSGADPSGNGEGEAFEYRDSITHAGGSVSYVVVFSGFITDELAATLTEDLGSSFGSTSEFSAVSPVAAGTLIVNSTRDNSDASAGNGACDTGSNNTAGDPECTLRSAIQEANALGGADIGFAIPDTETGYRNLGVGNSYWRIVPGTSFDVITGTGTSIDASTQTAFAVGQGYFDNATGPEVEIDGSTAGGSGLEIQASGTEVRGLIINRFATGVDVLGGSGSAIAGNFIGPDAGGANGMVGNDEGIYVYGATNTVIGGTTAADRNVISGNRLRGIFIDDSSDGPPAISDGTQVIGNYIGTNAAGTATLPYSAAPASQQTGLAIWDGPDNVIGTAADGNLFSGNAWYGIYIWGPNATNNRIQGNIVGLNATATAAVPNAWESATRSGVYLSNAPGNLIGGIGAGEGNIIASNDHFGVIVQGASAIDNSILSNEIYGNVDLGIENDLDGVTPNDAGDVDTGPNDLLNHPVITSATETAGTVTLVGTWDMPAGWYRIETFVNTVGDGSGYGEGESITGSSTLYHDGTGAGPWGAAFSGSVGDVITATATECTDLNCDDFNSTSEFSAAVTVTPPDTTAPVITLLGADPQAVEAGGVYTELGATALDDVDGDISGAIVIDSSAVNPAVLGSYTVTYDVSDAAGNPAVQVTRTVDVADTLAPVLTLLGANPQTIEVGDVYAELGAAATDSFDGVLTGSISTNSSAVNTSVVGSYVVTYDVMDSSGNPAAGIRTVNVVDTMVPVITLLGADPQVIEAGGAYVELGATASDNFYGDISGSIIVDASGVDTGVVGSYVVTYNVDDVNGNPAVQVTRTVDVVDTGAPVITLSGADPQVIEAGDAYAELGATAFDAGDGDLTGALVIDATAVDTAVVGSYTVTYNVTDSQSNPAVGVTRTVDVVDTATPVITLLGADPQTIEVGDAYSELGATASDNFYGDITGSIVIDASGVDTGVVGSYAVTYDVDDVNGNPAVQVTRNVDVVDTSAPVITLLGADPQTIEAGGAYAELGATASDNFYGDITGSIVIDASGVDANTVGTYVVTYNVDDVNGNPALQVTRTVDVVDTTAPVITLNGADPQSVEAGSPYGELGATAFDVGDGDLTGLIVIDATAVDTNTVGSYTVTYNVTDSQGNAAVEATRTVDVVDTTAPVITLNGADPQTIEAGSAYSELGATATDNYDGNITPSIVVDANGVNTSVVGSYTVTYDVADAAGNPAAQVTRTVNVVDTTAPTITLVGANPQIIEVGTAYTELGASADDGFFGDITPSIITDASGVDTDTVGSYVVTYDVDDAAGNPAVQVTRTVNVVDTTIPVITLSGADPQIIEVGSSYVEAGATATDNYDGDLTVSIVIDATAVDTVVVASYLVTYSVTDSSGNPAIATRTVTVIDTTIPVITLNGADPQVIGVGSPYIEAGATASDNYDGDLTGLIVTDSSAVDTSTIGSYAVTYNVTDANGNAATQVTRTVNVGDTTAPVISLVGADPQVIEAGTPYAELGATAADNYDGDISISIVADSSAVDTNVVGSYSVTYDVDDAAGNSAVQVTRTVNVVDTTAPVITLNGADPQIVEVGSPYVESGATALDNYDGDISGSIVINDAAVVTAVVGSYTVTYDVTDSEGNSATRVTRTVNVVDTTAPLIALVGANPQTIEVGSAYTELGATAVDVGDGDVTGWIVTDSSAVNTAAVGSYVVTYDVTDNQGNAATQVTRTVDVVDTTIPVITRNGADPQFIEVGSPYVELGASAFDIGDGVLTGSIVIDTSGVAITTVGSYVVTYDVTDSQGNAAVQVTRTVDVVDTTAPVITLNPVNPQTIEAGSPYVESGATATDSYDGDISGLIVIDAAAVNTAAVGSYSVTYDVTDANGNAASQVIRTVSVVDTTAPVITLNGANPQVIEVGSPYAELGATAFDIGDGNLTGSILINSAGVNTSTVGTYSATYDVTDSQGNVATQVVRAIDVVDTTIPVIALTGANPQVIEAGSSYVELGATAADNYDGDLTGLIVTDATAVDTATVGSYPVTYDVTDANGNSATQVTRTVNVIDTAAPVITLIGANPQVIEVGSSYAELGANASDVGDGDLSGSIVIDPSVVDTAVVGSYGVTYDVTDSQGNLAVQVTRTVDVVDTTLPVITVVGVDPQVIEVGSPYVELGATALDNYDGNITGLIVANAVPVDTATVGTYSVTYDVTDANGNAAVQVSRTVNVIDTTSPIITLLGSDPLVLEVGSLYVEAGATAFDVGDGDLTGSIVVDSSAVDTGVVGSYLVTYDVSDSQGNAAIQVTRFVGVVDTTAPVITLAGANPQTVEVGSLYLESGATAADNYDGDLSGLVVVDATAVDTSVVGSYLVTYDVVDANGNAAVQVTRTVNVVDTTVPVITVVGADPQVIEVGSVYSELGATAVDHYDGDLTLSIVIDTTGVDTSVLGSYVVTYDVTDSNGNAAVQQTRTVSVVDTTAPVLTLSGANPQIIEVGSPYVELGATAWDNYDGDLTLSIVVDATAVDTSVVGSYAVLYDVVDSSGNPAFGFRTVNVVDTTAPVITLVGANPQAVEVGSAYVELGATAVDNYDGVISGLIVIDATAVDTSVLGSYVVTYDVTDAAGNLAVQATRTVDVVDTTAPVITLVGANPQTVDVGSAYLELGATASDNYDGDITGSLAIDATGVNTAVVGSYAVTYDVTDANGNPAVQVTRVVNVVNVAPVLAAIADQTGPEHVMVTFTAVGSDPDPTDILSYSLSGAPAGATIDPVTGIFTWTPSEAQGPGGYTFDVVVTDTPGLSDQQSVTLTVTEVNTAPVLAPIAPLSVDELDALTFTAGVTDTDLPANSLVFSLAGAPSGATINTTTGVFSWTPTETQGPATYTLDITVDDAGSPNMTDTQTITVTVAEVNTAPVVAYPGAQSSAEADSVSFGISATDVDVPLNTLSYSAVGLPDGLTIDSATGEIAGTITYDASPGSPFSVTVTAADDGAPARSHQTTFNWFVADTNRDPVPADDNVNVPEDSARVLAVLSNDADPDFDALSISAVASPSHGSATVSGAGILYTPDADYFGADSFGYTVSDGLGGVASATVRVTVVPVNDAPVLGTPATLNGNEGSHISFTASASDVEGDQLRFSLVGAPAGAVIDASTGYFSWVPAETQGPGVYSFDVVVVDDGSPALSTRGRVEITVAETNAAPVVANPGDQVSGEDRAVGLQVVATDSDVPVGVLRYSATGLPPGLSIDSSDGEISGRTPFDAANGSPYSVTVTVTDDGAPQRSGHTSFSWTITNTNRPPLAADLTVFAEAGFPTSLVLNGSDPDGDVLSFAVVGGPGLGVLTGGPRLYDYTPVVSADGADTFTFSVSDGDLSALGTVTVEITPNRVPTGGTDEYRVRRGGVLVVDAPGVLGNDRDPEGRPITAVVDSLPAHGSVVLRSDGSFDYYHRGGDVDVDSFTYRVDDGMRLSEPITVRIVVEVNVAPVVVDDTVVVDEDQTVVFHPLGNDSDANGEVLVVTSVSEPGNGSVEWSLDGAFVYSPEPDWFGTDTLIYTVSDGDLSGSGRVEVVVRPVNDAPVAVPVEVTGHSGELLIVDLRPFVTDVDGDTLSYILETPVVGTVTEVEPGVFEIGLDGVIHDMEPLRFVVSDPSDERATSLLTVVVRIPASLVGVPSLVSDDLSGGGSGGDDFTTPPEPAGGVPLLTGLRLMVGSVFDTFRALRVPLFVVLLLGLGSLWLGLSNKFVFVSTPTVLPLVARRKVDVVMALSGAGVPARVEPGSHQGVKFRFAATERGVVTTGARMMVRSEVWVEVETPEGDGWVNAEFLTEQVADAVFEGDERPAGLVAGLVERVYGTDDLLEVTAGHDLHVGYYGPPIRFAASSLSRLLRGASVYWWWQSQGDTPSRQGTFGETVGESVTAAYRNQGVHQSESLFPVALEFVNMHSLVIGNEEHGEGWRVFFRYENDEPSIAGLSREAQPNPAAMHGQHTQQTA